MSPEFDSTDLSVKYTPSKQEFLDGINAFRVNEKRDAMYTVSCFLVKHHWGNTTEIANGLGVILLTWNNAFYRYGSIDFDALEFSLKESWSLLEYFKPKHIFELSKYDEEKIRQTFDSLLVALSISSGKNQGRKSPVSVAKVLHILAPRFFPLWDDKISKAYDCGYSAQPSIKYIEFSYRMKLLAESVKEYIEPGPRTLLKLIDEFNYSKYTKNWI
jgi:hypothetical protein